MRRIAIIDLGTNTFNLLISEVDSNNNHHLLYRTKVAVKLGEGGIGKGFIAPASFQRGVVAIKKYKLIIQKYKVDTIRAIATSAVRSASNGLDFVSKIKEECDIDIQVVSGDKEAEYIYWGVRDAVKMSDEKSLIIDIGGGSTEFIIANDKEIFWKESFQLGAARLLEIVKPSDPITEEQVASLNLYLREKLDSLFAAMSSFPVTELIGSSGSFDSLAEMIAVRYYTPDILEGKTEFNYNLNDIDSIHQSILKSTTAERLEMKGLIPMRVDMIVISSIIVEFILESFSITKMKLSTYSLKEGVMWEFINE